VSRQTVLQERVVGEPMSVLFAADGARATVFGVTRQLIGDAAFGATGFKYCGNLLLAEPPVAAAVRLAEAATAEFGLVGVNGIDCVGLVPVEINPRYTAAMELVERRDGLSIAATHVGACGGQLPSVRSVRARMTYGKAIVYARRAVTVGDTRDWLADPSVRDIPHPGQRLSRGSPICSVFAVGRTVAECYRHLTRRAERIYHAVDTRQRRAA
jgi:predicted ATP-grasp superfamily ATP-dependent carboligase